jgi:hypothetical protein
MTKVLTNTLDIRLFCDDHSVSGSRLGGLFASFRLEMRRRRHPLSFRSSLFCSIADQFGFEFSSSRINEEHTGRLRSSQENFSGRLINLLSPMIDIDDVCDDCSPSKSVTSSKSHDSDPGVVQLQPTGEINRGIILGAHREQAEWRKRKQSCESVFPIANKFLFASTTQT